MNEDELDELFKEYGWIKESDDLNNWDKGDY